jgi:hypothetical protein
VEKPKKMLIHDNSPWTMDKTSKEIGEVSKEAKREGRRRRRGVREKGEEEEEEEEEEGGNKGKSWVILRGKRTEHFSLYSRY